MTKTKCKWERPTEILASRLFHTDDLPDSSVNCQPIGTPCGGAECPDRREYPWAYWDDSGYDDEGVPIRDSRPESRAPGQETDRRKAERRQGAPPPPCGCSPSIGGDEAVRFHMEYCCDKRLKLWAKQRETSHLRDRRQPVCGNPECGELLCRADVMIPGSGSLLAARCTTHPKMHPETPHHADDGDPANPLGQPDGPCQRGREHRRAERDLPGLIQKGIEAVGQFADDALVEKLQSAEPCPGCGRVLNWPYESGRWRVTSLHADGTRMIGLGHGFSQERGDRCIYQHEHQDQWVDCPGKKPQSAGLVERLRQGERWAQRYVRRLLKRRTFRANRVADDLASVARDFREAAAEIEQLEGDVQAMQHCADTWRKIATDAEAQAARYREALEEVHPCLVKLAQEAWPDGDLYLHGSKFQGKTIPAATLHRLQQSEREVSDALHPEPDHD